MNFSINIGSKKLEALIMTTRTELTAQINALAETVSTEAAQVQANVKALADVVEMLKAQVAAFEAAGVELDFSAESAALAAVSASIDSIADPA
mgnify:CR=1 FL=1